MNKPSSILLFFLILFYWRCTNDKNKGTILDTIVFKENSKACFVNSYYDNILKQDVVYFCGRGVKKELKFFNLKGKLLKIISLKNVLKKIDEIGGVSVISLDTIVINSNYSNQVLLLNSEGEVWKEIDASSKLIDKDSNQYEIMASLDANNKSIDNFIYACYWQSNIEDKKLKREPRGNLDYLTYFYKNYQTSPHIISLSNLLDSNVKIDYHLHNFYKQISKETRIFAEPPFYTVQNQSIFVYSIYSDYLFHYSKTNFSLQNKIKISSDFTKIGTSLMKLNETNLQNGQDSATYKINYEGRIIKLMYYTARNQYYCLIKHQQFNQTLASSLKSFSLLIYNSNFIKLKEYAFENTNYDYNNALLTTKGLLLLKNDTTKSLIKDEKVTYCLFDFN